MSHLLQMRGLKLFIQRNGVTGTLVASFTDAWIETYQSARVFSQDHVASFTDAWIETTGSKWTDGASPSSRIFYRCVD